MLFPIMTHFLNKKALTAAATLAFFGAAFSPGAAAAEPLTVPESTRPSNMPGVMEDHRSPFFNHNQLDGASIGGGFSGDGGGVRFHPEDSDTPKHPIRHETKPVVGNNKPAKKPPQQRIHPTHRGFEGQATPYHNKHRERTHKDERIERSIKRLEDTGNFRQETLDKMREAAKAQQVDKAVLAKRQKAAQLRQEYNKSLARLKAEERKLRQRYKEQMRALEEGEAKPARRKSGSIGGGGDVPRGGGARIQPVEHQLELR